MRGLLGVALALGACGGHAIPEGTPEVVAEKVRFCAQMDRGVEDWCVFEALQSAQAVPPNAYQQLCSGMRDMDARDACHELFARLEESRAVPDLCERIQQTRLRESCFLTIAERAMRDAPSIQDAILGCQKAGSLESHCMSHLPAQRLQIWSQNGGLAAMSRELQILVQTNPAVAEFEGLGFSVANAALQLGGTGGAAVCNILGNGPAGKRCAEVFYVGSSGSFSAPPMPAMRPAP